MEVLERVDAGERFACVEYSIVLSQALNALGIPARRLNLLTPDHHAGFGRGHVVSEAWIDDFGRWVLFDGQNGSWWGQEGDPLGILELQDRYRVADRPTMNGVTADRTADAEQWFWYFAGASTTGVAWAEAGFSPVFQGTGVVRCERLVKSVELVAPDPSETSMGIVDHDGPAALFIPEHLFSTGVLVTGDEREAVALDLGEPFPLTGAPGTHSLQVAVRTRYGVLAPSPLVFTTC